MASGGGGWSTQKRSTFASRWDKSTSKAILQGILDAVTLPGDVYRGEVDPRSDEAIGRAFDLAGTLGTGGLATASGRAGVGVFGGRLAKTADLEKLKIAEQMATDGAYPADIWEATGWGKGADGKWRFEIRDDRAKLWANPEKALSTGQALHHRELFNAYPELREIDTSLRKADEVGGRYTPYQSREHEGLFDISEEISATAPSHDEMRSVLLHELQHAVQAREGFASGSNPGAVYSHTKPAVENKLKFLEGMIVDYERVLADDSAASAATKEHMRRMIERDKKKIEELKAANVPENSFEAYRRVAGEVEARNVQHRREWDVGRRRDIPPAFSEDTPRADQILAEGGQVNQASIRAYHGSPHSFDKFSSERIGTGEGAQAYGHGLYFAENEGVAKSYKGMNVSRVAQHWLDEASGDSAAAVKLFEEYAKGKNFSDYDAIKKEITQPGHTYEVDIAANAEDFLDWDKPLSEQPKASLLHKLGNEVGQYSGNSPAASFRDYFEGLQTALMRSGGTSSDAARQRAAEILRERGIPGIRYLDQGSRPDMAGWQAAQKRADDFRAKGHDDWAAEAQKEADAIEASISRNYVVFDDSLISILKKYGVVGPVLAALGLSQALPDRAEASEQQGGGW